LDGITKIGRIYCAWQDEPWTVDGASVRVSIICATKGPEESHINGQKVSKIHADLTYGDTSIANCFKIESNKNISFVGIQKNGPFDISAELARNWLILPIIQTDARIVRF
jgi:hypothetical protein